METAPKLEVVTPKPFTVGDLDAQINALEQQAHDFAQQEKIYHDQLQKALGALEHARHLKATFAIPAATTPEEAPKS